MHRARVAPSLRRPTGWLLTSSGRLGVLDDHASLIALSHDAEDWIGFPGTLHRVREAPPVHIELGRFGGDGAPSHASMAGGGLRRTLPEAAVSAITAANSSA